MTLRRDISSRVLFFSLILLLVLLPEDTLASPLKVKYLKVPYVNQKYDSPDDFDGRYSCGPTSVVMVLAYYKVLKPWPSEKLEPFKHITLYGNYIACSFKVGDFFFNKKELDASRYRYGCGVHGYVYIPGVGASWDRIVEVFRIFGFIAYVDTNPTWDKLVEEINSGHPVILSTQLTSSGHLIVAIGYISNHSVIVNDPAGDKNRGYYFNYYGNSIIYDWPGFNNGHVNLNLVKAMIIVHPTGNLKITKPVSCKCGAVKSRTNDWTTIGILVIFLLFIVLVAKEISKYKENK